LVLVEGLFCFGDWRGALVLLLLFSLVLAS